MKGVTGIMFRVTLDGAARNGVGADELLRGLDLREDEIRANPRRRYPWDDFVEILERLATALGGYEALTKASEVMPDIVPEVQILTSAFFSVSALYRFVMVVVDPIMFPEVDYSVRDAEEGWLRTSIQIHAGCKGCSAFMYSSIGAIRAFPKHMGLAPFVVDIVELNERRLILLVKPPPSRTVFARVGRLLPRLLKQQMIEEMRADKTELASTFSELRTTSAALTDELQTRRRLEESLKNVLDTVSNSAFFVSPDSISGANASGVAALAREGLALEESLRSVGRTGNGPEHFEVTAAGSEGKFLVIRRGLGDEIARRLERMSDEAALTPRQTDVLRGLVDGLSNAEIAARLGCTVRTVETHLTALLDRVDASSRLELVAMFWSGD
jgi:DNA-binding CsgD family transcriptional regulator